MTAERVGHGDRVGCVLGIDTGVAVVMIDGGEVRASYGGALLDAVARDRTCAPQPGDWVRLRSWCDGRLTIEECLTTPHGTSATVLAFRRR